MVSRVEEAYAALEVIERREPQTLLDDAAYEAVAGRVCAQVGDISWRWSDWGGIEFYAA